MMKFRIGKFRIVFWQFWTMKRYSSWEAGVSFLWGDRRGFCVGLQWPVIQRLST